jgi:tRNA A37 methylthiotransferase MiaB
LVSNPNGNIRVHSASLAPRDGSGAETEAAFFSLGCLVAYAKVHREGALRDSFDFGPITPTYAASAIAELAPSEPEIVLLSNYVWNQAVNLDFARESKLRQPESLVIVGGPHVPREPTACQEYFDRHPYVDIAVRHEGEVTLAEILTQLAAEQATPNSMRRVDLSSVPGLSFRRNGELVRTDDRVRTKNLDGFPSPYTTGEFDHWMDGTKYIPVETNRGCPYGCTFCDWGAATLSKVHQHSMDRVLAEVEYAAKNRIHTLGFCDANFGIFPRDVEIVRYVIEMNRQYGYPLGVGYTNAKVATSRLTDIIKLLLDAKLIAAGQISMQSVDQEVLENVERSNIKMSEYRKMISFFHEQNIPAVSDMLLGLPGQTVEKWQKDLQFCFDHKVGAVIFATSVMPNAPIADAEYQRRFDISVDGDGFIESTYSYTRDDYARMFDLSIGYKLFVKIGLLKYFLYFAQVDHGLAAMEFVSRWMQVTAASPERYPISARIRRNLIDRDYRDRQKDWLVIVWSDAQARFLFDSLEDFHGEILDFVAQEHGIRLAGSDVEAALAANRAVLPRKGRDLSACVGLAHDVAGYFDALRAAPRVDERPDNHVPLAQWAPGHLEFPAQVLPKDYTYLDLSLTRGKLELESNLRI